MTKVQCKGDKKIDVVLGRLRMEEIHDLKCAEREKKDLLLQQAIVKRAVTASNCILKI